MDTTRWNVAVSAETDQSVRLFLATQGKSKKGSLSHFIEESVRAHILELTAAQSKAALAALNTAEVDDLIDDALSWAREH